MLTNIFNHKRKEILMRNISWMKLKSLGWLILYGLPLVFFCMRNSHAGDSNGALTFSLSLEGLNVAGNFVWVLMAAFLILFMQAGFVLLGGLVNSKNMLSYMTHCFMATTAGTLIFLALWFCFDVRGF